MKFLARIVLMAFLVSCFFIPSYAMGQMSFLDFFRNQHADKPAADFTLKALNGEEINMTKYRDGKDTIIFFWATWCPHCRTELKRLNDDGLTLEKEGIKLLLVDLGENKEVVEAYVKKNHVKFPVLLDEESSLAEPYGIIGVPTFFLVNKQGVVKSVAHAFPKDY